MGYLKERFGMTLLPGRPDGTCEECAVAHAPDQPHDQQSLTYQYTFYDRNGRWPTWNDAMAHCSDDMKTLWTDGLRQLGMVSEE